MRQCLSNAFALRDPLLIPIQIVIYAKTALHPGQEILYDYKFPLESDPALRVPCLCGAATCRGWLN